jgi:hypothetical protein
MVPGPCDPSECRTHEDLVTCLLPRGEDARGNEDFALRYDVKLVAVE